MIKYVDSHYLNELFETNTDYTEWFGYYNYDVISRDGQKMLCNRAAFDGRAITEQDTLDLGWYDLEDHTWHYIDTTDSFNWEQGAMLQWMPGPGNENKVIYNHSDKKHFYSTIYDIVTGEKKTVNFPVYCVTPDGKKAISLNYERSYWCRAYHYQPVANPVYDVNVAEDDGIFCVDLERDTVERIISIQDIIALDADASFTDAKHWLEHIMLSKDGTQVAFLHRFAFGGGYKTRVLVADCDGKNLQVIPNWRENLYTHLGWDVKDRFVVYSGKMKKLEMIYSKQARESAAVKHSFKATLVRLVKKYVPRGLKEAMKANDRGYRIFEKGENGFALADNVYTKEFFFDGHPSFSADGRYIITDTYPDENDNQNLIFYDTKTKKSVVAATLFAGLKGNPASCDLHPKVCCHDRYVVVDTAYSGKHKMILFEINWDAVKKKLK